jgi:hypothetical protein
MQLHLGSGLAECLPIDADWLTGAGGEKWDLDGPRYP